MVVTTEEELGRRVQNGDNRIEIEGDLVNYVIRIKATGNVSWAVIMGAIVVAILAIIISASRTTKPEKVVVQGLVAAGAAGTAGVVSVLGYSTTVAAIAMVVAVKNWSVLKNLRNKYNIVKESENKIVLLKKVNHKNIDVI